MLTEHWKGPRYTAFNATTLDYKRFQTDAICGNFVDEKQAIRRHSDAPCTTALSDPEDVRASPQATRADRKRIKELERDLLRKDRALAETAALLVLSKKVAAIFNKGEDE